MQTSVYSRQGLGVSGEFSDDSPRRVAPYHVIARAADDVSATGTLTFAANVTAADTVTVGVQVYTFRASGNVAAAYDVLIGADAPATIANLIAAVNLTGTAGTTYGTGTAKNVSATAVASGTTKIIFTAIDTGVAGNSVVTTEAGTNTSFGAATLTGGTDAYAHDAVVGGFYTATANDGEAEVGGTNSPLGVLVNPKQYANYSVGGGLTPTTAVNSGSIGDLCTMGHIWIKVLHTAEIGYIGIYNTTSGVVSAAPNSGTIPSGYAEIANSKYIRRADANGLAVLELRD